MITALICTASLMFVFGILCAVFLDPNPELNGTSTVFGALAIVMLIISVTLAALKIILNLNSW